MMNRSRPLADEPEVERWRADQQSRRWVVERAHSWFNRYRRLLIRWEKDDRNHLALLHLAAALITRRTTGRLTRHTR